MHDLQEHESMPPYLVIVEHLLAKTLMSKSLSANISSNINNIAILSYMLIWPKVNQVRYLRFSIENQVYFDCFSFMWLQQTKMFSYIPYFVHIFVIKTINQTEKICTLQISN